MSNLTQLKQKARSFEQREQWPSALDVYEAMAEEQNDGHDPDVGLWNRIGDLHMRLGRSAEAVAAYERAVAAYETVGLHNNAIALCNKILRITPNRTPIYLRLGLISAAKGFFADARQHLGRYIELVAALEGPDTALDSLLRLVDEGAADDSEVRRAVAEQLSAHGRSDDALRLLRAAHAILIDRGFADDATRVWAQVCEIDPHAEPDRLPSTARRDEPSDRSEQEGELEIVGNFAKHDADDDPEPEMPGSLLEPEPEYEPAAMEILGLDGFEATVMHEMQPLENGVGQSDGSPGLGQLESLEDFRLDLPIPTASSSDEDEDDRGADQDVRSGSLLDEADPALPPITLMMPLDGGLEVEETGSGVADGPVGEPVGSMDAFVAAAGEDVLQWSDANDACAGNDEDDEDVAELGDDWSAAIITPWPAMDAEEQGTLEDRSTGLVANGSLELEDVTDFPGDRAAAEDRGEHCFSFDADDPTTDPADGPEDLAARLATAPADFAAAEALSARGGTVAEEALTGAVEALLEQGDDAGAQRMYELAVGVAPGSLPLLRCRVELAQRTGESAVEIEACVALAGALESAGEGVAARTAWEQVLEIDSDHVGARTALGFPEAAPVVAEDDGYIDLAALIMEDESESGSTRFVVEADAPTGDEDHDFSEILARFREQVSRNIAHDDANAHYDLGVAFKEMGLLEEATSEFQLALRAGANPLATMEMLGGCFVSREQYSVGRRVLDGAVRAAEASDGEMVGLLYWLGRCEESLGGREAAAECFERVLAVDVRFRDASERLRVLDEERSAVSF